MTEALLDKARVAKAERAVMVTTPASVKACMLKLLELLHLLETGSFSPRARLRAAGTDGLGRPVFSFYFLRRSFLIPSRVRLLDAPPHTVFARRPARGSPSRRAPRASAAPGNQLLQQALDLGRALRSPPPPLLGLRTAAATRPTPPRFPAAAS